MILAAPTIWIESGTREPLICIDPGHPSEVGVGTKGKLITEVAASWKVALELKRDLQDDHFKVVLTKASEMQFVSNRHRAEIANETHAAIMVRLHCDAGSKPGFAVYYPAEQARKDGILGPSKYILEETAKLAPIFHDTLAEALRGQLADRGLHTDRSTAIGGKQGALTGSIYSHVPVVLVEMADLQNPHDDALMASDRGRRKVATALAKAVEETVRHE